ncbi:transmembrane protein 69-like [Synchiropus splendidus]|uniref:transmembrane protein 69-like n=1 Tax=Synchiropus splendidus TaxID=270530 RepID=UPI00237E49FB|nr:transmembrane protein 69-like [Synchiropus splendidus]
MWFSISKNMLMLYKGLPGSPCHRWRRAAHSLTMLLPAARCLQSRPLVQQSKWFHSSAVMQKKRAKVEPSPRELDLLRYDMGHLWKSPRPPILIGSAGLLPFVLPPLIMSATECYLTELAFAQLAYGASILSFLGGARWGFALPDSSPARPDWLNLSNAVVPPLLACTAVLLADSMATGTVMVVMGLGIALHYDLSLLPGYPPWMRAMRAVLTIVAVCSLLATLALQELLPEKTLFPNKTEPETHQTK